ncbi:nucleotidyltransferase [candidate division KSB1 bacterium]
MEERRELTLGILAAGMGSRYGGLKQVDPILNNHILMEYSIYDAIRAGFSHIVLLIRKDFEAEFRETVGKKIEKGAKNHGVTTGYAFQESVDELPRYRTKMWGTGHAVLRLGEGIGGPFAVINADDFYGRDSFITAAGFFNDPDYDTAGSEHAAVGFRLKNVMSEHGPVARGICRATGDGYIEDITEMRNIARRGVEIIGYNRDKAISLAPDTITSMNFFGFNPAILPGIESGFAEFLSDIEEQRNAEREFFMSDFAGILIKQGDIRLKMLSTEAQWFGMTYTDDRAVVIEHIRKLVSSGVYPGNLWGS